MDYLLDTNIVSLAVRDNSQIRINIEKLRVQRRILYISCITYFEIRRGFLAVDAPKQRQGFEKFCQASSIIFLDDLDILEKAAEIHANLRLRGLPIQTEDVLIAATAITKNLTLVSNDSDLEKVKNLQLQKWINS